MESLTGAPPRRGITVDAASTLHDAQQRALAGRSVMVDIHVVVSGVERANVIHANPLRRDGEVVAAAFIVREIPERSQTHDAAIELSLTNLFAADDEALETVLSKTFEFLCSLEGWARAAHGACCWSRTISR